MKFNKFITTLMLSGSFATGLAIASPAATVSAESLTLVEENVAQVVPVRGGCHSGGYYGGGYGGGYYGGRYGGYGYGGYRGYGGNYGGYYGRPWGKQSSLNQAELPSPQVSLRTQ